MIRQIVEGRKPTFHVELAAALAAVVCAVYYAVQANADGCFGVWFLLSLCAGVASIAAHAFLRWEFFLPLAGVFFGAATGFIVHDMLPTLSDVWNGVHFIGGNLTAYIVYTAFALLCAVCAIVCTFLGTERN